MAMKLDTGHRTAARFAALGLLAIFCAAAFFLSIGGGAVQISLPEIWRALFLENSGVQHQIVVNLRLPRALCGAMVGACLAVSGVLLQAVMRNPLASPSVIGVSSGAGFFGMLAMVLFPGNLYAILPPAAFAGGLLTALAIYLLAWRNGINPTRMILAGVATSTFLRAGVDALMVFFPDQLTGFVSFSVGGLSGATWRHAQMLLPYAAAGLILAVLLSQRLDVLLLGDEAATGLGPGSYPHTEYKVGLIAPHLIRMLVGSDERYLVPGAALGGAALVMFCDTLGRILAPPIEVPVGIILAVLGAPFFLYLLRGRTKRDVAGKKYFHQLRRKEHP
ncbi:FecCD family ABC transporter permease [Anaeromassilibacillus senegalensis]|uniref:FecCD family ABC transporter permease n=1 Tax=Anaeromassilibacillus senegalensis TaxID=1673717 RepID=UPI00068334A0|nr:iron ABC transporter permease [Anaeromassilibacillus senegalensis]